MTGATHRASWLAATVWLAWATAAALGQAAVSGELKVWHTVTLTIDGPATAEDASPNPFTDYRLEVRFAHENGGERRVLAVPGYYAADGRAGETGATAGNKWQVKFVPDAEGEWEYTVSFRTGRNIALERGAEAGQAVGTFAPGRFAVAASDKKASGRDFRGKGRLRYVGGRYLRFAASGEYYLKAGADSPENFLAYADFDNTYDTAGGPARPGEATKSEKDAFLHEYRPHLGDWREGNPTWRGGKGKGIVGALNYLASQGMNSVYFLTYNLDGGDGKDVWPWTSPRERMRFDCSKLDQWEIVFSHMDRLGLQLHVVTQETENDQALDGGELGPQRRLYYRELVARFAHHLALEWNLGEENTNTTAQLKAFAEYIHTLDAYRNKIVVHTYPGAYEKVYRPLVGDANMGGVSLQMGDMKQTHAETLKWVKASAGAGRPWVVCLDEIGPSSHGVLPDKDDPEHDLVRAHALWGNLMAGGGGCEWYFGYQYANNDLNCEDWRSRERMWAQTRYAVEFFQKHLPLAEMAPADEISSAKGSYAMAKAGAVYVAYVPTGGTTQLRLPEGSYTVQWYNPRQGGDLREGSVREVRGAGEVSVGSAPGEAGRDWVVLVRRKD